MSTSKYKRGTEYDQVYMAGFHQPQHFFAAPQENKDLGPHCRGPSSLLTNIFFFLKIKDKSEFEGTQFLHF